MTDNDLLRKIQQIKAKNLGNEFMPGIMAVPKAPEGVYQAVTSNVELEKAALSKFGVNDKLMVTYTLFTSTAGIAEEITLRQTFWKSSSEESAFYRHLYPLLGKDPREGFMLSELMGIPCEVTVAHYSADKGTFAGITNVRRLELSEDIAQIIF